MPALSPGTGPRAGWRKVLRANPALARLAIAAGAFGATQVCLNSFIVTFLVRERGLELAQAGWVAALTQGSGLVGRLLWGWVASRVLPSMSLLRALGCVMIVCALTLGTLGATMSMAALLPLAALFGLSASGWNGVFLAEVAERSVPEAREGHVVDGLVVARRPLGRATEREERCREKERTGGVSGSSHGDEGRVPWPTQRSPE